MHTEEKRASEHGAESASEHGAERACLLHLLPGERFEFLRHFAGDLLGLNDDLVFEIAKMKDVHEAPPRVRFSLLNTSSVRARRWLPQNVVGR